MKSQSVSLLAIRARRGARAAWVTRSFLLLVAVAALGILSAAPAWCVSLLPGWPQTTGSYVTSSPALGDLDGDGDGDLEVVVGSWDGKVYAWHHDGAPVAGWPQTAGSWVESSPALGDLDGDGTLEVVVGSWDCNVYAWTCDTTTDDLLPWPMFHHDARHTGLYTTVVADTTLVLNSVSPASVTVGSSGPVALTATLTRNDTSAGVVGATVAFSVDGSPVGTAVTGGGGIVTLNYDPSALAPGSHTVQASFGGQLIGGITFLASASNALALKCVYNFIGFLPPVDNPPVFNLAKAGRTIPVKWQLKDANGAFISTLSAVVYNPLRYRQVADDGAPIDPVPADATTTGATVLRYDSTSNQFIFNWQTSSAFAGKCYELLLDLNDGTQRTARFKFTR